MTALTLMSRFSPSRKTLLGLLRVVDWRYLGCAPVLTICLVVVSSALALEDVEGIRQIGRPAAVRRVRPDTWGTSQVELTNLTDQPVSVVSGGYFSGETLTRYARRAHLPARSIRRLQIPALATANEDGRIEWNAMLSLNDGGRESLLHASNNYYIDPEVLLKAEHSEAAIIANLTPEYQRETDSIMQMMVAVRLASGHTRRVTQIDAVKVPAFHRELDVLDQVMLGSGHIANSPAALDALRSWVYRGGKLWICLDQTGTAVVHELFGDSVPLYLVDRTELVEFEVDDRSSQTSSGERLQFDYPVDSVRVDVANVEVIHEVNRWPASFITNFGDGRVVFTTLGKRAWIRRRTDDDPAPSRERNSLYLARPSMVTLMDLWHKGGSGSPVTEEPLRAYLSRQTGYEVPSGSAIVSILVAFCVMFIATGARLHSKEVIRVDTATSVMRKEKVRPEHLALIGCALATGFAALIILLGQSSRSSVVAAICTVEFARIDSHSSNVQSTGFTSIYSPDGDTVRLQTQNRKILQQPKDASSGTVRRLMWTDYGQTVMEDLHIPAGIQFYSSHQQGSLNESGEALVTFGPDGITGEFSSNSFLNPEDAVIAGPAEHTLAVSFRPDGTFSAPVDNTLEPGTYIADSLLSDQQALRQEVYRSVLQQSRGSKFPSDHRLLVWTTRKVSDLTAIEGYQSSHTSFVSVPLRLIAPPPNTSIVVPSPLVRMELLSSQGGGTTTAYNARARQWLDSTLRTNLQIQFSIPTVLVPLDTTDLSLEFRIAAPGRRVTLTAGLDGHQTIAELSSPAGTYNYVVKDPQQLQRDNSGKYYVGLMIDPTSTSGDRESGPNESPWKMEFIRMEVRGRTIATASPVVAATEHTH